MKRSFEELFDDDLEAHAVKAVKSRLKKHELLEIREQSTFFDFNLEKVYQQRSRKTFRKKRFHHSMSKK